MEYWIRSTPPLVIRKAYLATTQEVIEWMNHVISISEEMHAERKETFPAKKDMDIFKECFVLLKVDTRACPEIKRIFKMDADSIKWLQSRKKRMPHLEKLWKSLSKAEVIPVESLKKSKSKKRFIYKNIKVSGKGSIYQDIKVTPKNVPIC